MIFSGLCCYFLFSALYNVLHSYLSTVLCISEVETLIFHKEITFILEYVLSLERPSSSTGSTFHCLALAPASSIQSSASDSTEKQCKAGTLRPTEEDTRESSNTQEDEDFGSAQKCVPDPVFFPHLFLPSTSPFLCHYLSLPCPAVCSWSQHLELFGLLFIFPFLSACWLSSAKGSKHTGPQ